MKSKLFLTMCRTFKGSLMVLSLALAAGSNNIWAQSTVNYCEPSDAVKDDLKQLPRWTDEIPYKRYQANRLAALKKLAEKYPGNFHVLRGLAEAYRNNDQPDREGLTNEYRALMEKNPNDPVAAYFYASVLVGNNTKEAIAVLDKVIRQAPEFPWAYLELNEFEQREKRNSVSDLFPREDGDEFSNLKYTRWYSWPLLTLSSNSRLRRVKFWPKWPRH